jgi:hypothetical protein
MSEQTDDRAAQVMAEAENLIKEIQGQLDASDEFYRQRGLSREHLRGSLNPEQREESERLLAADMAAVEREMAESKPLPTTRPSFYTPSSAARPAKRRMMI